VQPPSRPSRNRDWLWGMLLLAATLLAYRPAWSGQPVWDDAAHMTKPALRSAAGLVSIWTQLGATQQYYPVMHTVFWLEHHLWGGSTVGYHLLNILLHVLSALLLLKIVRRLDIPGAWLAAGMFALHPVMVESVAWITELKNTLSGALFFGAALAYLEFDSKRRPKPYAVALGLFLFGLLTKTVIGTLPAVLLVVFWWMRGTIGWKRDVRPLVPFFLIGIAAGLFTAWVERKYIGAEGVEFSFTFVERCLIAGRAIWFYLYKLVWPANLVFIYPRWSIDATAAWQYLFPAALLLVAALCWGLRSRSRAPLAVLLYFAIALFPALGFFNVYPFLYSFVADHFQYLASVGPIVAVAAGLVRGSDRLKHGLRRPLQRLLPAVLLSAFFLLSWGQSRMYANAETLYRTTVARNDSCWMAHTHLGLLLMDTGRGDEAMVHLLKALELHPHQADAHSNLGLLLTHMGRADEAMSHLTKALALQPQDADVHNNLGMLLTRMGRPDEAMPHYQKALELQPNHARAHSNIGDLLANMGRIDEAEAHYREALQVNPEDADAHNHLGSLLAKQGRTKEAIAHFREAIESSPTHAYAHNNLGFLLAGMGRTDEAIAHYRKALAVNPLATDHLDNLVSALLKKGQIGEAMAVLQNAMALAKSAGDEARAETIAGSLARLHQAIRAAGAASAAPAR
jgi:Flp pilus assembly protein TadD